MKDKAEYTEWYRDTLSSGKSGYRKNLDLTKEKKAREVKQDNNENYNPFKDNRHPFLGL